MNNFDPTITSLEAVLKLLKHDWVHKFFFATTKSERLSQLSYALNNPVIMSGKLSISRDADIAINTETDFLFAPSFTTGSLTVGFDVTDRHTSMCPVQAEKSLSWAVRDDDEGIFLSIAEHPHIGFTELAWCTKITPGCKCMVFILIKTFAFHHIMEHGFDEEIVGQNLSHSFYSLDVRPCPSCRSNSLMSCSCRLSSTKKKHPSDYDGELKIFDSYVGAFDGFASLRSYDQGRVVMTANCVSTISTSVTGHMEWKRGVSKWAMRETARDCCMNVAKLCMPDVETERDFAGLQLRDITFDGSGDDAGLWGGSQGASPSAVGSGTNCGDGLTSLLSILHDMENDAITDGISASDVMTSMYGTGGAEKAINEACSEKLSSSDEAMEGIAKDRALHEARNEQRRGLVIPSRLDSSLEPNMSSECHTARNRTTSRSSINVQLAGANDRAYVVDHITMRRLVPIAPSDGLPSVRLCTFSSALQQKAEVRKARNRASALRSNEKKRIYLKKLKEDITAAGKMEANLREKERSLREENVKLRASIYRKGS